MTGRQPIDRLAWAIVALAMILYVAVFATLSVRRHDALQSNAYDLAIFDQAIWNTAQGRPFSVSIKTDDLVNPMLLGDHFSPAIAILAPIYWVWDDVRALLIVQPVLLAAGAVPVALAARGRLATICLPIAYLLVPTLHFTNLYDFHEVALAVPALSIAAWALVEGRRRTLLAALVFAILTKEEVAFVVAGFGGALMVRAFMRRTWRDAILGLGVLVFGLAWGAIVVASVIPALEGSGRYNYVNRYGDLGDTPVDIAVSLITRPQDVLSRLNDPVKGEFVLSFFLPFALLPLAAPEIAILALPSFGYLLISIYPAQYSLGRQYGVVIIPLVAVAAAVGWRRLPLPQVVLAVAVLAGAAWTYVRWSPGPGGASFDPARYEPNPRAAIFRQIAARIPAGASVAAQENLAPHLSHRERLYLYPSLHGAEWVILDNDGGTYPVDRGTWDRETADLLANPLYESVIQQDGFGLFRRRPDLPGTPADLRFGDTADLIAVDTAPGEIGLIWRIRSREPLAAENGLVQTIRLVSLDGRVVAEAVRPPRAAAGYWENGHAVPGEVIRERIPFPGISGTVTVDVTVRPDDDRPPLPRTGTPPVVTIPR